MNKKNWLWIVLGALFPPLFAIPIFYFLIFRPIKDGVIGGSHIRFYFWASFITSLSLLAGLPIKNLSKAFLVLNDPANSQRYIISSFILAVISIFMLFYSTRNEPEKSHFLPIRKFKPDQLFFICLILSVFPLLMIVFEKTVNLSEISHPFSYAIAVAFKGKDYLTVLVGMLTISITTAILEESFFRGILLRDYFTLGKIGRFALLTFAAFYFAISHIPISFLFPLFFAIFINKLRLAYNNLLPGIILHAIWNICVTIAILSVLDTNPAVEVDKSFEKLAPEISAVWTSKNINDAKTFYPQYKISNKNFYTFTEKEFEFYVITENTNEYKISWMMLNLKKSVPGEKIQVSYPSNDWITKTFQKLRDNKEIDQELTCSEKIDLCFKPNSSGIKKIYFGLFNSQMSL